MAETKFTVSTIFAAILVRTILILHNCLAVWRVGISRDSDAYWGLVAGNIFIIIEGILVIRYNGGIEWTWWCPCFLTYLLSTLPAIWLLQLSQYDILTAEQESAIQNQPAFSDKIVFTTDMNITSTVPTSVSSAVNISTSTQVSTFESLLEFEENTWIVVIQESLVYLLVFSRWILPRESVSREALSDLLLEFLAMASDIMELYAIFDEDVVKSNLQVTYAILVIWSISFMQFVPVLVHKNKYAHLTSPRMKRITRACGDYFTQVVVTLINVCLQDGPFLILRLYIMIGLNLITYSLVFFVLKNIVTLLVLFYRLLILCIRLPCCYHDDKEMIQVETIDFSHPVLMNSLQKPMNIRHSAPSSELEPYHFSFGALY